MSEQPDDKALMRVAMAEQTITLLMRGNRTEQRDDNGTDEGRRWQNRHNYNKKQW